MASWLVVRHVSWRFLFPGGLCGCISCLFFSVCCISLLLSPSLVCVPSVYYLSSLVFILSLSPCPPLSLPSSGTSLAGPHLNPLLVPLAAASTESGCSR